MTYLPPVRSPLSLSDLGRALVRSSTPGDRSEAFCGMLSTRFGADRVILTASGTEALDLAIRIARVRLDLPDAPVALPAYSCYDLVSAAVGSTGPFMFYDVVPASLSPDPVSLERAAERGARTFVVSPLYGYPVDWRALKSLRESEDHVVIEDAAQGAGSSWNGREVGSLGDLSVLSFGRGKGWTGGGGGALLVRGSPAGAPEPVTLAEVSGTESLRRLVASTVQWAFSRPSLYGLPARIPWLALGETTYHDPIPPRRIPRFSARLAEATAAGAGRASIARVERGSAIRRRIDAWAEEDERVEAIRPVPGASPTCLRVPAIWKGDLPPELRARLRKLGVETAYPRILPDLEASRGTAGYEGEEFPGAALLARHLLTFPTHPHVTDEVVEDIVRLIRGPSR